ncbi:MAG: thiazole synthase [Bacteroidia bacterium]|nr:thiazole synthase [Bacteroidia bacterium]
MNEQSTFKIGEKEFSSRLLIGSGGYPSAAVWREALQESGAEIFTVSIRRVNLQHTQDTFLTQDLFERYQVLPNTSGCYTVRDAILTAELAREATGVNWIKLEILGDEKTLLPDPIATVQAAEKLVGLGFTVLPYCGDDPILCKYLEEVGCAAVMPLAAPIGSGMGVRNPQNIQLIRDMVSIPVIIDAGIGTASDAAIAIELGCDAVLLNTAIADAQNPVLMARAFKLAIEAGYLARQAGRIPKVYHGRPSSPIEGTLFS